MGNFFSSSSSCSNSINDAKLSNYDIAIYEQKRNKVFWGTIAICIIYTIIALIMFFGSYMSRSFKYVLLNRFFTLAFFMDKIVTLFYLLFSFSVFSFAQSDGTLDISFGGDGTISHQYDYYANSVSVQSSGKLVVCSDQMGDNTVVTRYLTNGNLDNTFGTSGIKSVQVAGKNTLSKSICVDTQNAIWVAGYVYDPNKKALLTKLHWNSGALDGAFGSGGQRTFDSAGQGWEFRSVHTDPPASPQSDGKALVAGVITYTESLPGVGLVNVMKGLLGRVLTDGNPDPSFGQNGFVTVDPKFLNGQLEFYSVVKDPQNRIVVVGYEMVTEGVQPAVTFTCHAVAMRFLGDGTLDPSFGQGGKWYYVPMEESLQYTKEIHALSDGGYIVTGLSGFNGLFKFLALKLTSDGNLDPAFATNGVAEIAYNSALQTVGGNGSVIQSDGKILLGGALTDGLDLSYFAIARLHADGTLDPSFGSAPIPGFSLVSIGDYNLSAATKFLITPQYVNQNVGTQERIVMAGLARNCTNGICQPPHIALSRLYSSVNYYGTVGHSNIAEPIDISTSPNPFTDYIKLSFSQPLDNATIRLTGPDGRIFRSVHLDSQILETQLEASELKAGVYIMEIFSGSRSLVRNKLVKID